MKYQVSWKHHQLDEHNVFEKFDTFDDAIQSIYDWWDKNDYTPNYVRYWKSSKSNMWTIDYGFHHMFYYIEEIENKGIPNASN